MGHAKQPISEMISGHALDSTPEQPLPSQRPHLALSPLPDVGHMHASGNLLGIAAILPRGLNQQERKECLRTLGAIGSSSLVVGRLGIWMLERQNMETGLQALLPETWSRVSSVWATVTPFVFGHYPNSPYGSEAVEIICESCRMAGLPEPAHVEIGPVSVVLGVPRASDFPSIATSTVKPRKYHVHLRLRFAQPIQGPVLIGWGRYLGYGLCRPMKEEP